MESQNLLSEKNEYTYVKTSRCCMLSFLSSMLNLKGVLGTKISRHFKIYMEFFFSPENRL